MKHKHAEILQAIAEDRDAQFFYGSEPRRQTADYAMRCILNNEGDAIRLAPKTIRIGHRDVPEPMRVAPAVGTTYWRVHFFCQELFLLHFWQNDTADNRFLKFGLCHLTEAAAREHAEALIKVNGGVL